MKPIALLAPGLAALLALASIAREARAQAAPPQAAGQVMGQARYVPPEGDFSVVFPATPNVQTRPAERSKDIGLRRYTVNGAANAFVVAIDAYPPDILPQSPNGGVYDHLLRTYAEDGDTRLISTRPARLAGLPCLEGTYADKNDNGEIVRVLVVGDVIWKLTYAYAADVTGRDAADAFFASFQITPH